MDYVLLKNRTPYVVDHDAKVMVMLRELLKSAAWRVTWNYCGAIEQIRDMSSMYDIAPQYTQKEWNQTLITKVNQVSAQIHKSTLRGGADTIVIAPEILPIFNDLECYDDIRKVLGNRYEIIVNKYMPTHKILVLKTASDPQDWYDNNRLYGIIKIDGIYNFMENRDTIDDEIILIDKKYLLI